MTSGLGIDMAVAVNHNGTWRYPKELHIHDGSAWRQIHSVYVNNGSWRRATLYIGTLVVAQNFNNYGKSGASGSITPTSDGDGYPFDGLYYSTANGKTFLTYFDGSNPFAGFTQTGYIKELVVDGITATTASAEFFQATGNTLSWYWDGDIFGLPAKVAQSLPVQLTAA